MSAIVIATGVPEHAYVLKESAPESELYDAFVECTRTAPRHQLTVRPLALPAAMELVGAHLENHKKTIKWAENVVRLPIRASGGGAS